MVDYQTLRTQSVALCEDTARLASDMQRKEALSALMDVRKKLGRQEIVVLVCGEMKRGKSSLLGALLDAPDLFPTDVNVATNAITVVSYGEKESVEVLLEDEREEGQPLKRIAITRDHIREYVTEQANRNNQRRTKLVRVQIPHEVLRTGLVFVDTPGVGSLNHNHAEIAYGYLPNADVMLFVGDALSPLTQTELAFLTAAHRHCQTILYPLTKADLTQDAETIVQANREKIAASLSVPPEEIEIIPVSSVNRLSTSRLLRGSSNFRKLEEAIWTTVHQRRSQILLLPGVMATAQEIGTLRDSLMLQQKALGQTTEAIAQTEAEMKARVVDRKKLTEAAALWRPQMQHDMGTVGSDVTYEMQGRIASLQTELAEKIRTLPGDRKLEVLTRFVNERLSEITFFAKEQVSGAMARVAQETADRLGLDVSVHDGLVEEIGFEAESLVEVRRMSNQLDKAIAWGGAITRQSMGAVGICGAAGAIIGGGLGMLIGGPALAIAFGQEAAKFGAIVGTTIGTTKGIAEGSRAMREIDAPAIQAEFNRYVGQKSGDIRQTLTMTVKNATHAMVMEIEAKLRRQLETLEAGIGDLQLVMKNDAVRISEVRPQLRKRMDVMMELERRGTELLEALRSTRGSVPVRPEVRLEPSPEPVGSDGKGKLQADAKAAAKAVEADPPDAVQAVSDTVPNPSADVSAVGMKSRSAATPDGGVTASQVRLSVPAGLGLAGLDD